MAMQNNNPDTQPEGIPIGGDESQNALRFEDLTIDDDLPLLDRVVRYCRSGIALQRLVHVKMLAETAETVGTTATLQTLVPLLNPLVSDPESIIRQHLASQLLPISITCMLGQNGYKVSDILANPADPGRTYYEQGYKVVISTIVNHLNSLITDSDLDVRRSASDALAGLALQLKSEDVASIIVPIPMRMAHQSHKQSSKDTANSFQEELRITAGNLLAELAGASENGLIPADVVQQYILPTVLDLCGDKGFRVRRSASQALPRVLAGSSLQDAEHRILPAFLKLSRDEMYRVRKSTGECLVDMSRSLMLLASKEDHIASKERIRKMRRELLIPVAVKLLGESNKFVRHGMMQFLGPFIASFYPLDDGDTALHTILPKSADFCTPPSDNSITGGIGAQFFPHASSMVSRLNSSSAATSTAPTPTLASLNQTSPELSEIEQLQQALPQYLQANRMSILSLRAVVAHRKVNPPDEQDLEAVISNLLGYFCGLAQVKTGDDNTDAEMRVYCAYSFPAVVLLLGPENWEGALKGCFLTLINPNHGTDDKSTIPPPLPVKRCLASSLHTVAHILGPSTALSDIMPMFVDHFFRDTDDSVRLNVLKNFSWLLSLLPAEIRSDYLYMWGANVKGEEILSAYKRSATNPMLLNWRQRDFVSRSMPDMLGLVDANMVQEVLWPVIQLLLTDSVNIVREDAMWCIPLLLKVYCPENLDDTTKDRRWSTDVCKHTITWLKEHVLGGASRGSSQNGKGNFSQRQLYCRICATIGLALRFADVASGYSDVEEEMRTMDKEFHASLRRSRNTDADQSGPYQALSSAERKHLKRLLVFEMLPAALEMKDDRVTNVRLTLMKVLQIMPKDVRGTSSVGQVLKQLEDEVETWEAFNGNNEKENESQNHQAQSVTSGSMNTNGSSSHPTSDGPPPDPRTISHEYAAPEEMSSVMQARMTKRFENTKNTESNASAEASGKHNLASI
mmetsp:Transcript_7743/g.11088  ORF Transcript_7743/g.11088 Transcript_7743/m.11088 type:complete len:967 (-) Transcript_7743:1152-4052(-)